MISVLVTGANGQLGSCLQNVVKNNTETKWQFKTSEQLDITKKDEIKKLFSTTSFNYVVNCAAFTAVDKAEKETEKAFLVNAEAVKLLAEICKEHNSTLIHLSTDFVFDGKKGLPYTEEDLPNPINVYGASKLKGEYYVQKILKKYFIIRTSLVYSEYGVNFIKTMLKLSKERNRISVVNDQLGSPTYAMDLAEFLLDIIEKDSNNYGVYHFSNSGEISWYDFAKEIFQLSQSNVKLNGLSSSEYVTMAKRPAYSVLDNSKRSVFGVKTKFWKDSLGLFISDF